MQFEFDEAKSKANKDKHGIDFEEAQALWDDQWVEIELPNVNERRAMVTGKIGKKYYSAIVTERSGNIRIISVRRARKEEIMRYGENSSDNC